jgi:HAD superfamily hydrolase (TIGR01549 family)
MGNPMKPISLIAFDCDGVLFDTARMNRLYYNTILNHLGMPDVTAEQFEYVHMHTVHESLIFLFGKNEKLKKAEAFRQTMSYDPFLKEMQMEPYLIPLLIKLRPKFKTAIATNRTDTMDRVLTAFKIKEYFDLVVCAKDVLHPKPHPEPLIKIIDHFGLEPEQALYVGDTKLDKDAAKAARIPFVAYGAPSLSAEYHIESLKEIEDILEL